MLWIAAQKGLAWPLSHTQLLRHRYVGRYHTLRVLFGLRRQVAGFKTIDGLLINVFLTMAFHATNLLARRSHLQLQVHTLSGTEQIRQLFSALVSETLWKG
jgi:esterase/lipase superfamily enzyme